MVIIRAAKSLWPTELKEMFCVDSSADMNSLALKLIQQRDPDQESDVVKGLYFRQFMPTSAAVSG